MDEPLVIFEDAPTVPTHTTLTEWKLDEVREAARRGERWLAYQLSREASDFAPENVEAWFYRAMLAEDREEKLMCLSKTLSLAPQHEQAQLRMYEALRYYLAEEPFLRFAEETEGLYRVLTREGRSVLVPKDRAEAPPYPPIEPTPLQPVSRWLVYSLLGLPLAGLITVVCAPIAALLAWRVSQQRLQTHDRRRALMALLFAVVLLAAGLFLSFIFVLHLV